MSKSIKMVVAAMAAATVTLMTMPAGAVKMVDYRDAPMNASLCTRIKYAVVNNDSKGTAGQLGYLKRCIAEGVFDSWTVGKSPLLSRLAKTPAAKIQALAVEVGQ